MEIVTHDRTSTILSQNASLPPIVLITSGDPAGIGPEIVLKALADRKLAQICRPLVIGEAWIFSQVARHLQLERNVYPIDRPEQATFESGQINLIDLSTKGIEGIVPGRIQALAAESAISSIKKAVSLALHGWADSLVTGPVNKQAIKLSNYSWLGHTEMLKELTGSSNVMTMFVTGRLHIFFATRHLALQEALYLLKKPFLYQTIVNVDRLMRRIGFHDPRLAIAGLNPHAGEAGLFGKEEIKEIGPAVKQAQEAGIRIEGPFPADSIFYQCIQGLYEAVIALTHDQGHIAAKTRDFYRTVSATLGLPFIRTSVDHGTAFDIAWRGEANSTSMKEAIKLATKLVKKYE